MTTKIVGSTDALSKAGLEAQKLHFQSNPPSCLSEFQAKPADLNSHRFDGHGEEINSYWSLVCPCGSERLSVQAYSVINEDYSATKPVIVSPIALVCDDCGCAKTVFDSKLHGYDPVACGGSCTIYGPDESGAAQFIHSCRACKGTSHKVYVRFEYPGDLIDEDNGEFKGREVDLFTWFSCVTDCLACGSRMDVADFECA